MYEASYAALPHIVEIACNAKSTIDFSFFQLPAAIEIARHGGKGRPVPVDLATAYNDAVLRLTECVALHRHALLSAVSALSVAKGHHRVAEAITSLDDDFITRLIELDFGDS